VVKSCCFVDWGAEVVMCFINAVRAFDSYSEDIRVFHTTFGIFLPELCLILPYFVDSLMQIWRSTQFFFSF